MDVGSGLAAGKGVMTAGQMGYTAWGWFKKWWYGKVSIDHPGNRDRVTTAWVELSGSHNNPKRGHSWLMTVYGDKHWLKTRIDLKPDGRWKEKIHIGNSAVPRDCVVALAWASDFTNSLLLDIQEKCRKGNNWDPVKMKQEPGQFSIVQSLVLAADLPAPPT